MLKTASVKLENATPMMQQYFTIKAENKDCLLLFRMGDFYELFYEDAITAAPILEVTLTKRGKSNGDDIPMCGVPYHSVDIYIQKLIKAGHKVAICEQLESPEEAKKRGYKAIVKREIVRIITPGTLTEDNLLEAKKSNYLASLVINKNEVAIAYADISTLDFNIIGSDLKSLASDLNSINPAELIIPDCLIIHEELKGILEDFKLRVVTFVDSFFDIKKTRQKTQSNFGLCTIESLGNFSDLQISACGSLLEYLCVTQKKEKLTLNFPHLVKKDNYMVIDKITQSNLELFESKGDYGYSLLKIIDQTVTNAGGRLFRKFLAFPSVNIKTINDRLDLVEFFVNNKNLRDEVRQNLKSTPDLERAISKIAIQRGSARDLYHIKQALSGAFKLAGLFDKNEYSRLPALVKKLTQNKKILDLLNEALMDRAVYLNEEDFIRHDYNLQLEELYIFRDNSRDMLDNLRKEYIQKTGVTNLKIEFNNVLGYYIEVTKIQSSKITSNEFIHRQTMINNVRFVTNKLKELESKVIDINHNIEILESQIFNEIANELISHHKSLLDIAKTLAYIDVIAGLAHLAIEKQYCRPEMDDSTELLIENGRHPVVEHSTEKSNERFIENSIDLNTTQKIWLITGPNMSGKSTFLRQNALITILAHMGSFVPASKATIGMVDRVFSRIGAGDDLAKGHSTFLVEMIETATILNQATNRSLIILDEIGRGTSTYDGMAIAWSCLEYIHNNIKGRTLFSTHYHELTELSNNLANLKCYTVSVKEWENKIIFMHKVIKGIANRSYGINVAEIAGIPKNVIQRSKQILHRLHDENASSTLQENNNLDLFSYNKPQEEDPLRQKLSQINPDELSPKEALNLLYQLKKDA